MRESGVRTAARQPEPETFSEQAKPGPTARAVVRTYDRFAPLYDWVFGRVLEPGRKAMGAAASALHPAAVLEVGVGTGLTLAGYPADSRVVGIDLSADMLERARTRAAAMPQRQVALQVMNAERMEFADDSFDCVTVPYVLSVTPHPARLVHEIRRVCKPGGAILVVNHFSGSPFWWLMERAVRSVADRVGFRSDFAYEEHILAHDWHVESVRPVNLFRLSKLVVLRNDKA
ncbi:class I SAM-dependent methyltransferase [Methylibium sp.]|uniref:class I SAM-dependent methyltransferase n=1 Tax=Methylibium sp. TaxID=2067992 RepID=UPI0017FC27D5|nr:class I SAM-dependent methyltransferase [Methylibium sp.]MBA3592070.1 class I SAM-dependent methyltransferase [Methylibium sp.]